jgi:Ni/Co efflux regulator RcnB
MRKALLAGLAGLMLAGPALADQQRDYRDNHDYRDDRRDDMRDARSDDRRDDRNSYRNNYRNGYKDGRQPQNWRGNDRWDNNRWDDRRGNDWRYDGARYRGHGYIHPRGHGYRAWGVGNRVPQAYFINRYYIGNPGYYRLPPAFPGTRWVRVGVDALLIDLRAGLVVRAVRGLYW